MMYRCNVCGNEFEIISMNEGDEEEVNFCPRCGKDDVVNTEINIDKE